MKNNNTNRLTGFYNFTNNSSNMYYNPLSFINYNNENKNISTNNTSDKGNQ